MFGFRLQIGGHGVQGFRGLRDLAIWCVVVVGGLWSKVWAQRFLICDGFEFHRVAELARV